MTIVQSNRSNGAGHLTCLVDKEEIDNRSMDDWYSIFHRKRVLYRVRNTQLTHASGLAQFDR